MDYTEFLGYFFSEELNEEIGILKYESKNKVTYCQCSKCDKDIKKQMYVVQSKNTDIELLYLGKICFENFKKHLTNAK